jgi:hypothetical protein
MPFDGFNPGDPTTWPVWMREDDICTEGDHVGPFPASRFQWRKLAPPPVKFGSRIACWHRNTVAAICKLPPPDPEPEQPAVAERAAPAAAATRSRTNRRRVSRTPQLADAS